MRATYRLQLTPTFGFAEVRSLLPYFQRLGISHLYLSPITEARPGSLHGYDVTDHNQIRQELGGREEFLNLLNEAKALGLGLILDFVPNHMAVGYANPLWQDVLTYGPYSPYSSFFDIDWHPLKPELEDKILLPQLGAPYGEALDRGELQLGFEAGRFLIAYYDHRIPLTPLSYPLLFQEFLSSLERQEIYWELKALSEVYAALTPSDREQAEALRPRLEALVAQVPPELLQSVQGPALHQLLERQYWRLAYWKTAGDEINYRRFFDINDLVALRMEVPEVFWVTHRLLGELLALGVEGVRIDHLDGLFDPAGYLKQLRALGASRIWVEKILAPGEILPESWEVEGTTGYEFLNDVMGLLLDPRGEIPLDRLYRRFVGGASYAEEAYSSRQLVMRTSLSGELFRLAYSLDRLSEADYHTRDYTLEGIREALSELIAVFPRYRTYLPEELETAQALLQEVLRQALARNPASEPSVYGFIAQVLLGRLRSDLAAEGQAWTGRFQQYTAPVAAKGLEDTAFYRYARLSALCEVGGDPERFGLSPQAFHARARYRAFRRPNNLLATATHDHKRGEDTRARLLVLAELPEAWGRTLSSLSRLARKHRGPHGPSAGDEYLFAQTLLALWGAPDLEERLVAYMVKAAREAKLHTSWLQPNPDYERDLERFVRGMLQEPNLPQLLGLAHLMARHGFTNSLSQLLLKLTTPGIPDFYQGTELLALSLVDPDNRQPVDFELRAKLLLDLEDDLRQPQVERVAAWYAAREPKLKLYVMARLLRFRREHPHLFSGSYRPLETPEHLFAFIREHESERLLVWVPRFPAHLEASGGYGELSLPRLPDWPPLWEDLLTGVHTAPLPSQLPLPFAVLYASSFT